MVLKYRKDYIAPHYELPLTELDFKLDKQKTIVKAKLHFKNVTLSKDLLLNGQYMKLLSVKLDGCVLSESEYKLDENSLTLYPKKSEFVLETEVEINPEANTRLMGLYVSNDIFCTQCEPEGFRSITYYPDHSDVPSKFIVSIEADRKKYPVLLSNGNKIKEEGNRIVFEDPFNKPCYLFALVAGDLDSLSDTYTTLSGKEVSLNLYCEKGKKERLTFALDALKRAMRWDEEVFGLEYDLDRFSIVAVSHFNAGAMENKSLNIFNDAALLASPDTATDASYEYIDHVIAHEYFHNYSGDRVTLRSWFDLSLKEGLTVFRDSEYGYDTFSRAVARIDDVTNLRAYQFPEDDGPLAHAVRPDSYHEIDNFYTSTIYEKGAEVIRMQRSIVGHSAFMKGCALYFTRHDGQAVTIDDFVKCIEDASGQDLTDFKRWYSTPGRPTVKVKTSFENGTYTVTLKQSHKNAKKPFVIPLQYGLLGKNGKDIKTGTFILSKKEQSFVFKDFKEKPVLSINRFFTSPITLDIKYTNQERLLLMKYDSDLFNRYETGHQYAIDVMVDMIEKKAQKPNVNVIKALGSYLTQKGLDKAFVARAVALPSEEELFEKLKEVSMDEIRRVRLMMRQAFAKTFEKELLKIYKENQIKGDYVPDNDSFAKRAIKNIALAYLALTEHKALVYQQFKDSNNLTDRISALNIMVYNNLSEKEQALQEFYDRYENEDLVLNKWFAIQARSYSSDTLTRVQKLLNHPKFDYKNPNKVRGLIGAFGGNLSCFHTAEGYKFYAQECLKIDKINPHMAARLFTAFAKYLKFDANTQEEAKKVLKSVQDEKELSGVSRETIERMI